MAVGVSFCIPTYKRFDTLVLALESVLDQKGLENSDYEILISDDNNDMEIQNYIKKSGNNKIKYLQNKEHGQFNNLNNLVQNASKEWLVFLHDDDLLKPDYLNGLITAKDAQIFFTDREYINQEGKLTKEKTFHKESGGTRNLSGKEVFDRVFFGGFYKQEFDFTAPMLTGISVKKKLVQDIGGFDNRLPVNSDALFLNEIFLVSSKVFYMNEPLVSYRVVEDSERAKPSRQGIVYQEMKKLFEFTLEFAGKRLDGNSFTELKKRKTEHFYKNCMAVNGPLLWVALRYEGTYISRFKILFGIVRDIFVGYPKSRLAPVFYILLLASLLPKKILELVYKAAYV